MALDRYIPHAALVEALPEQVDSLLWLRDATYQELPHTLRSNVTLSSGILPINMPLFKPVQSSSVPALRKYLARLLFAGSLLLPTIGRAQQTASATKTYIRIGHDFLRALYPELSNNGYTITVETFLSYDEPDGVPRSFDLDVGKGAKYSVTGCCFGGSYAGTPPDLAVLSRVPGSPSPTPCPWLTSPVPKWPKNVDGEGQFHPEQYLSASFNFDVPGRLEHFVANGPAIENREEDRRLHAVLHCNPAMTGEQIATTLKESGAKYGLNDRDKFRKNLPIKELEPFLGKLEVVSLEFSQMDGGGAKLPVWITCDVWMRATQKDGTQLHYRATFDHFKGALESLNRVTTGPVF